MVGAVGALADPHDDVDHLVAALVPDVEEVAGLQRPAELLVPLVRLALGALDDLRAGLAVRALGGGLGALPVDVGVQVDAERPVVVPAAEVAAVDALALLAGAALVPWPALRRVPVGHVVVLVLVADEPRCARDHPLALPVGGLLSHLRRAVELPDGHAPGAVLLARRLRVPLLLRYVALLAGAPAGRPGVEEELLGRVLEVQLVGAAVGTVVGLGALRVVHLLAFAGVALAHLLLGALLAAFLCPLLARLLGGFRGLSRLLRILLRSRGEQEKRDTTATDEGQASAVHGDGFYRCARRDRDRVLTRELRPARIS